MDTAIHMQLRLADALRLGRLPLPAYRRLPRRPGVLRP